jgi:hypothetical protein
MDMGEQVTLERGGRVVGGKGGQVTGQSRAGMVKMVRQW